MLFAATGSAPWYGRGSRSTATCSTHARPGVKLGTSTPRADPAGDYAWEVFRKADKLKPGAFAALEKKALQLTGGPNATAAPGRTIYGVLVAEAKPTSSDLLHGRWRRRSRTPVSRSWPCRTS